MKHVLFRENSCFTNTTYIHLNVHSHHLKINFDHFDNCSLTCDQDEWLKAI